ncbi:bile acid:sodium symporter, partial [Paracidovorax avenae]
MARSRFLPDNFTLALIATVALASVLPAAGQAARGFEYATTAAV